MASSSGVRQQHQQQQFKCNECSLALNSAESLEVHLQYQCGSIQPWAVKTSSSSSEEKNNNMTKVANIKREFASNSTMQNDGDVQKRSPEYNRTTPESIYAHPPTPQSYQSASSPYQSNENSSYQVANFQNFPPTSVIKSEAVSPATAQHHFSSFAHFPAEQQQHFFSALDQNNPSSYSNNEIHSNAVSSSTFRYTPYGRAQYYDAVKAGSPNYPPQPTPSPSPKHCDKCGFVCETAAQLADHNNLSHPPTQYNHQNYSNMFEQHAPIKEEEVSQSDILDLDSQKVVHPAWAEAKDAADKRPNGDPGNPHSISTMLNPWPSQTNQQSGMFHQNEQLYMSDSSGEQKMFALNPSMQQHQDSKLFSAEQKVFAAHQIENQNFINGGVSSSSNPDQQQFRTYEHLSPPTGNSVISSSQVTQVPSTTTPAVPSGTKSSNWKSNEARRPKTYNCTACNKWFTSSGHLKRHYNTTLHKNAVKSSGQPDPASMPISAHHHPTRDSAASKEERQNSNSPREDSRGDDSSNGMAQYDNRLASMSGYDRSPMPMHSPLGQPLSNPGLAGHMMPSPGFSGIANGSPPNGETGLSPHQDARGLITAMAPANHSFNMMPHQSHMMPMDASQIPMYPNGYAPHVTQVTAITSNLNITGECYVAQMDNQPLPSFAQIQAHRFAGGFGNVGGLEAVTSPASLSYMTTDGMEMSEVPKAEEEVPEGFRFVMSNPDAALVAEQQNMVQMMCPINQFSPTSNNNNNNVIFTEASANDDGTYLNADSNVQVQQPAEDVAMPAADSQGEAKENYEEGSVNIPDTPSTDDNQEDVSKTKCFDCDKVFNRPCYLTQHNKTFHSGDKPFKCQRCGKRFSTEETFECHASKHAGDKPHKCDKCPKMFNHKTDLRRHICCHTGRKPYACVTCGKGFIRKDHMIKHMDTHLRKNQKLSAMRS